MSRVRNFALIAVAVASGCGAAPAIEEYELSIPLRFVHVDEVEWILDVVVFGVYCARGYGRFVGRGPVSIHAEPRTNTLWVRGPLDAVLEAAERIHELDFLSRSIDMSDS